MVIKMEELDKAYENTKLQEKPVEELYRVFLEDVRRGLDNGGI